MLSVILSVPVTWDMTLFGLVTMTFVLYVKSKPPTEKAAMPKLYYKDSALARHIRQKCARLSQPFRPPAWATNRHVQTFLAFVFSRADDDVRFEREYLQMKDKGVVALDWAVMDTSKCMKLRDNSPLLLALPGLTGDATNVSFLCKASLQAGYRPLVFNKRGHGGSPLTTPRLQSFGDPSDLRQVVAYLRDQYPGSRLTAVGISTGSGLLASYLGEYGSSCHVDAAVCVSPTYDAERTLNKHLVQPYHFLALYAFKRLLGRHARALAKVIDLEAAMQSRSLAEFEERVYCQLYGCENMGHYWDKNNPIRDVDDIQIPVLCINSLDDPVCVSQDIPFDLFHDLPNFMLVTTEHGGHAGFLEAPSLEPWAEKLSLEYLSAVCSFLLDHS